MIRRKLKGTVKHPKIEAFLEKYKIPMEYFRFNRRMLAKGVAIGLFFAFIPMPLQILTVILLAPLFKYNIPAAVAMCLLTNPLTMPIVYYIEYLTGSFLLGIEPQSVEMSVEWFSQNISKIFIPLYFGALFYSTLLAVSSYYLINWLWRKSVKRAKTNR